MGKAKLTKEQKLTKALYFYSGIFVCLVSIALILNMGTPIRVVTYGLTYLFGAYSMFLYGLLYVYGYFLLVKEKRINFKTVPIYIDLALILLMIGCVTLFSIDSFELTYNESFSKIDYINSDTYLNLFSLEGIGGGFIGNSFAKFIYDFTGKSKSTLYVISILVIVIGAIILFTPYIIKKIRNIKAKKPSTIKTEKIVEERVENIDIIQSASEIETPKPISRPNTIFTSTSSPITNPYTSVNSGYNPTLDGIGTFTPAHFNFGSTIKTVPQEKINRFENSAPIIETVPVQEVEKEEVNEQLTLDFNNEPVKEAEPVINEKLLTAKPVFIEPVSVPRNDEKPINKTSVKTQINWVPPSSDLLEVIETAETEQANIETAEVRKAIINRTFEDFGVGASVVGYVIGPSVTRFDIEYQPNVSHRAVNNIREDISRKLGGIPARFESFIEGSFYSGLEIANAEVTTVSFKDVYEQLPDVKKHPLAIAFGKNIQGNVVSADVNDFPHGLIAGTTGSGKSIFIHSIITTLIMRNSPDNLRLGLIDPKKVEMVRYRDMPHLLCPIITEPAIAKTFMDRLVDEMNDRYAKFAEADGATSLKEYNGYAEDNGLEKLPFIVVVVDEYGDLVESNKEISQPILLIGQKARACGIHMLISTQSPTTNIITGTIKNNLPTHIALCAANINQSVTMIGESGAETLLGHGDMLVQSPIVSRAGLVRLQGCFIQKRETSRVLGFLKEHYETHYFERFLNLEEVKEIEGQGLPAVGSVGASSDPQEEARYQGIKAWVMSNQYMSMSRIQGECSVGFNRARRFFTRLQQEGIVATEVEGNKGCRVLAHDESDLIALNDADL